MYIINLESGMPTVSMAMDRLRHGLQTARSIGEKTVKIIHGYGSSGKGGAIKSAAIKALDDRLSSGSIKGYVKGEDFSPFSESARALIRQYPALKNDRDYARGNDGITIVWF